METKRRQNAGRQHDRRQGIALIIVLGMLAVMMVLGVAFVTAMRTERVAAGNFMEVMKARHLVYTALARAMDDIEEDMSQSGMSPLYPDWYTNYPHALAKKSIDFYTGDAQELVPLRMLKTSRKLPSPGRVTSSTGTGFSDEHAEWNDNPAPGMNIEQIPASGAAHQYGTVNGIEDNQLDTSLPWSDNDLYRVSLPQWQQVEGEGRIAYLVVDASGLLDGSYVGGATSRGRGASPHEILVGSATGGLQLPDVNAYASPPFGTQRDNFTNTTGYAYENMAEMIAENTALDTVTEIGNIGVFSRFPDKVRDPQTGDEYDLVHIIDQDESVLAADGQAIKVAFAAAMKAGASAAGQVLPWNSAADVLYDNLLDYVDPDSFPRHLDRPSVEAIPMLNEIWIQNDIPAGGVAGQVQVFVECAYPFLEANTTVPFTLSGSVSIMNTNGVTLTQIPMPSLPLPQPSPMYLPIPIASFSAVCTTNPAQASYSLRVDSVEIRAAGTTVDALPYQPIFFSPVNTLNQGVGSVPDGRDVLDPVFNWDPSHWELCNNSASQFYPYSNTLAKVNKSTDVWGDLAGGISDGDGTVPYLHVANGPLQTVGELGYLYSPGDPWLAGVGLLNVPNPPLVAGGLFTGPRFWRSLWLYDHGDKTVESGGGPVPYETCWARVLDYFGQYGVPAGMTAMHGAVNPNTPLREVLASVFMNMQIDELFDAPTATFSSWNGSPGALQLADAIRDQVDDPSFGPMDRLSELGREDIAGAIFPVMQTLKGSALSELEKESFYRNAAGLLNPRQNIFYILLAGKSNIAVEQRALAVVWRDPIADPTTGRHPSYIRWFTWLEE